MCVCFLILINIQLDITSSIQIIALAKAEDGNAQIVSVMEPVPYMEKGITSLLMIRNSPLMGTVATFLLRYSTNLGLVFVICLL